MKADVEAGIVGDQLGAVDEGQEFVGDVVEGRLAGEVGRADAVHRLRFGMDHAALRIDVVVKDAAGREAVDQLDAAELDDAVLAGIEAGGFGIEDDLAHRITPQRRCISEAAQANEPCPRLFPSSSRDDRNGPRRAPHRGRCRCR